MDRFGRRGKVLRKPLSSELAWAVSKGERWLAGESWI